MILEIKGKKPKIHETAYVAETAAVTGDVEICEKASIWFGASLRGDVDPIYIGKNSNIQDNVTVHTNHGAPAKIGNNVTVGHNAVIHGCEIGDDCLIGMGAIILSKTKIGKESLVGAGALVTENNKFPPRSLILGAPAKVIRTLTDEELVNIKKNTFEYVELMEEYSWAQDK